MGQDLGPDARGFLKINDFMWLMSKPLLVEVLAPWAPQLLGAFKQKLQELKTAFLKYKAQLAAKSTSIAVRGRENSTKSPHEIKAMERAYHENILTKKFTEDTVRSFLKSLQTLDDGNLRAGGAGSNAQTAGDTSTSAASLQEDPNKKAKGLPLESGVSGLHVRILVERMDCERGIDKDQGSTTGAITEESMLGVLQDFAHDQLFKEDFDLFQDCLRSMIHRTLEDAVDSWVDPDKRAQMKAAKEYTGVVVHSQGALSQVGRAPLSRGHMHPFFSEHDPLHFPMAMRASNAMKMLAERREREVYSSNPWKTYWQESGRRVRMAFDGSSKSASGHISSEALLAAAQDKVRKTLFLRFDNISAAFVSMDHTGKGVVSTSDFKKGIADLRIGLTEQEVDALISAQGGSEFIIYKDFLEKYATSVEGLADIAQRRQRDGIYGISIYSRLRKDLAHAPLEEGEDPDRAAARAAAGLVPSAGAQV